MSLILSVPPVASLQCLSYFLYLLTVTTDQRLIFVPSLVSTVLDMQAKLIKPFYEAVLLGYVYNLTHFHPSDQSQPYISLKPVSIM